MESFRVAGFSDALDWRPTLFKEPIIAQKTCAVCGVLYRKSVRLPCIHTLCTKCHAQCVDEGSVCPVDKKPFCEDDVEQLEVPLKYILNRTVACWNAPKGCSFIGPVACLLDHYKKSYSMGRKVGLGSYMHLHPGEHDSQLEWPFSKVCTVCVIHPKGQSNVVSYKMVSFRIAGFSDALDWRPTLFQEPIIAQKTCVLCGVLYRKAVRLPCNHTLCTRCQAQCVDEGSACPVDQKLVCEDGRAAGGPSQVHPQLYCCLLECT
ncbi:RING finger protein 151-like [Ixodes scapularis]